MREALYGICGLFCSHRDLKRSWVSRTHHLLKTFWTGTGGWADQQLPDGTIIISAPSGLTYETRPGSALLFPGWNTVTPPVLG